MPDSPGVDAVLSQEARIFARYIAGSEAEERLVGKYVEAHRRGVVTPRAGSSPFDRWLAGFARQGVFRARLADTYAGVLYRNSLLRRKLVLVLALLETGPAAHASVLAPSPPGILRFLWRAAALGVLALLSFLSGFLLFTPVRLALGTTPRPDRKLAP